VHSWLAGSQAVVFDFYGTLIDDDVDVPPMWRHLETLGFASHSELEAAFEPNAYDGSTTPSGVAHDEWAAESWRSFLRLSGVPAAERDTVLASLSTTRETFHVQRAPGVDELLGQLRHDGVALAICSNWESPIGPYLELAGLEGFDAVVTSREVGARKPHRLIYDKVLEQLGVGPEDAVFIGDTWAVDIVGALRSGMRPIWLRGDRASRGLDCVLEVGTISELVV
jgi:putative hydrolase of the HAD superfamily